MAWIFGLGDNSQKSTSVLNANQVRFMLLNPETGEQLTAIADFSRDVPSDILYCYIKNINNPTDVNCLYQGEVVRDSDGIVLGNRIYDKKME